MPVGGCGRVSASHAGAVVSWSRGNACESRRNIVRSTRAALGEYSVARSTSRSRSANAAVRLESRTTRVRLFTTPDQSVSSGDSSRGMSTVSLDSNCHVRLSTSAALASTSPSLCSARSTSFWSCSSLRRTAASNLPGGRTRSKKPGASICTTARSASFASLLGVSLWSRDGRGPVGFPAPPSAPR